MTENAGIFRRDKAVIIVNSLLANAGVERRTLDFAQFVRGHGLCAEVCVLREVGKILPLFEEAGITVRHIQVYQYDTDGSYIFLPAGFLRLIWYLLHGRFGLVFCVQPPSSIFGRLACIPPLGRGIIAMERYLVSGRSKRRLRLDRWLAKWSRVVCVSTFLRDDLAEQAGIPAEKIEVIEDGVTIAPVSDPQTELSASLAGRFVFGCVGLLTKRKRQALLILAFAEVLKASDPRRPPALLIVGDGEDRDELKKLVTDLKLENDVVFTGEQIHVHDFYPLFDAFVFPSVGEGLGNVWIEAMQHGLPVICADVRPMNDYIRHNETGLLSPPDDSAALAAEMLRLMESKTLHHELGGHGKTFADLHFEGERQMQKLLDLALR